ncbi:MAG: hypothetical protein ABI674_11420 [Spartobacteria bacterium]
MSVTRRNACLAFLAVHLTLVIVVCAHDTFGLLKRGIVSLPFVRAPVWETLDNLTGKVLGANLSSRNPWKQAVSTYTNAAGIEVGYGYFAPNIPATYALVFEWHYADGRIEYEQPSARGEAGQLRLTTLIEQVGRPDFDRLRKALIKLLADSTWQKHPKATSVRVFFGTISPPALREFRAGKKERTFTCLYVYDLQRTSAQTGGTKL